MWRRPKVYKSPTTGNWLVEYRGPFVFRRYVRRFPDHPAAVRAAVDWAREPRR